MKLQMNQPRKICFLAVLLSSLSLTAQQSFPAKGEVFRDDVLPSVFITLNADSLDALLDPSNIYSDYHYQATFVFDNGTVRDTLTHVGFRLRGNTSRKASKKSFKVSFNEYMDGQDYYGLEKMNLNGEHNDPSISRSKLCFDLLRYMEVPASRANHVRLYINGNYFGLYANVEHIDEEFTQSRFGSKGNLYKCFYGANLAYRGAAAGNYKLSYYELKKPFGSTDYQDLATFIDVLNNTADNKFGCALENVFNVNSYLKCVAMDVLTGNWDGPNYNMNNFYLYHNPRTNLFEYIPYDLDNTLGIDFVGRDWSDRDVYTWSKGNTGRPLFDKIIARPRYRAKFTAILRNTMDEYFNPATMNPKIDSLRGLIKDAALEDEYRTYDYGYTDLDFNNAFSFFSRDHVDYGIKDYIAKRVTACYNQLDVVTNTGPIPYWYTHEIDYVNDSVTFLLNSKGDFPMRAAEVMYNWDAQSAIWADMLRPTAEDNTYSLTLHWPSGFNTLAFLFRMTDSAGVTSQLPSCDMYTIQKRRYDLPFYINELKADNEEGITDEEGKAEDWIELYYDGDGFVNSGLLFLTDDLQKPRKYPLSLGTVAAKSFHLIWADDDEDDGPLHANFKLGKAGDEVALFDAQGELIDWVQYDEQTTDISWGRSTDGGEAWQFFQEPTPRASNTGITRVFMPSTNEIGLYPNPTLGTISLQNAIGITEVHVYNLAGMLVAKKKVQDYKIDLSSYPTGVYILKLVGVQQSHIKRVLRIY